jgi:hypothetical protein
MRSAARAFAVCVGLIVACGTAEPEMESTSSAPEASPDELLACTGGCLIYCEHEGTGAGDNIIDDCTLECMQWTDTASYDCKNALHIFGACAEYYGMHECVEEAPDIAASECAEEYTAVEADCLGP